MSSTKVRYESPNFSLTSVSISQLRKTGVNSMPTDIKNQQNKSTTCEKNNISSDIIVELQQARRNLELANFIHQDFIRTISISLNKSCNNIFALSTMLHIGEEKPNKKNDIAEMTTFAKELMYYSRNITNFTSYPIPTATTSLIPLPTISRKFKPEMLVDNVINRLMLTSKHKGIRLVNNFYRDIPNILIGDSYRIEAILTQLITNAINFTEEGSVFLSSQIFLASTTLLQEEATETKQAKDVLEFILHDTGIGMSEEQQKYIYEQLNGLDSSTFTKSTSKAIGEELQSNSSSASNLKLGLGLSLVKQFIADMNGAIDISSQQGKKTTFTIQVPVTLVSTEDINNDEINNMAANKYKTNDRICDRMPREVGSSTEVRTTNVN
ncbi:sensor histidine kinase [Candidatus Tisiphia endosymbiont of Ceraclea dissimilis]|uniref:sensor histidine kinase n=1 Tax=Candidatus Tisiphia endosymbiont of Ceraclea dissimilis TaxID=3077928 RepID=UPI003CCA8E8F